MSTHEPTDRSHVDLAGAINWFAEVEGWGLFNDGEIQRDDEADIFASDEEAVEHVRRLAEAGSALHREALSLDAAQRTPTRAETAALLERLQRAYPALGFDVTTRSEISAHDGDADRERAVITFGDTECCYDPLSSGCGRFTVDPQEAYGITMADAQAIRAHNGIRLA